MTVRLIDAHDRERYVNDGYPSPALRPRIIRWCDRCGSQTCQQHPLMAFTQSAYEDGIWTYRAGQPFPIETPADAATGDAIVITADEREHAVTLPAGETPTTLAYGDATATLWTVADFQGRRVYRVLEAA